jgi:hypothetical protein
MWHSSNYFGEGDSTSWRIAWHQFLVGKYYVAQSLGCDVHRMMAVLSFSCGLPRGRNEGMRHRLVFRNHWQSLRRRRTGHEGKLRRDHWR